jgi:hypothetical protein
MDTENYTAIGTVHNVGEVRVISDKFSVQEFVVEVGQDTDYPQLVQFQCANKKLELLQGVEAGAALTVHFNLRGREWKPREGGDTRYFNSLDAWRIERHSAAPASSAAPPESEEEVPF